jgi:LysR family transcriptional regulator, hydrogen peroxide-inducible genes activator
MELYQVRYFVALAKSRNFTRAAEQCNVTQPALTKAVQKLEYELGGPLVFRERQLTQLTDLGKLMLPMLENTLTSIDSARANAREFKRKKVATLSIALTPSISASILMKPLAEVTRLLPGLQIDLVESDASVMFDALLNGEANAALGSSCIGQAPDRIDRWKLFEEQVLVACAKEGRLAEDPTVKLKDLRTAKWLEPTDCELARTFREAYLTDGRAALPRHRGRGLQHLQHLVGADLGIMLAPQHAPVAQGTVLRPIADVEFTRTVELFVVAGRQYSPALNAFMKICRSFDWPAQFAPPKPELRVVATKPAPIAVDRRVPVEEAMRLSA